MRKLTLLLGLILVMVTPSFGQVGVGPGQNRTPVTRSGFSVLPWMWTVGDSPQARYAMADQGYTVYNYARTTEPGYNPDFTVATYMAVMGGNYAAGLIQTHGKEIVGQAVVPYYFDNTGYSNAIAARNAANAIWPGLCYVEEVGPPWVWAVWVTYSVVANNAMFCEGSMYDNECCYGATAPNYLGTAVWYGPTGLITFANSHDNVSILWGGMDGNRGWQDRSAGAAYLDCPQLTQFETITNGHKFTLAPAVKWTDATPYALIPAEGLNVKVLLDTYCSDSYQPTTIFREDGDAFAITSGYWTGDTLLTVNIDPVTNTGENRVGTLVAQNCYVTSMDCQYLLLDGDATGGPSDWTMALKYDDGPAAQIDGVDWKDGAFTWDVVTEFNTAGYRVEGNNPPDETWYSIGDLQPPGVGKRSLAVGNAYARFRPVEVEESGHERIGDRIATGEKIMPQLYPPRPFEELVVDYKNNLETPPAQGQSALLTGEKIVVYVPSAWMSTIVPLLDYMHANYGVFYEALSVESFATDPTQRFAPIKADIAQHYNQGYRYVLLGGDASDYQYFATGGQFTTEYWGVGNWETIRLQYIGSGHPAGGNPSNLIIPAKMIKDQRPRGRGVAWYRPYYELGDAIAYGDVDGDSLPDMAVGRWPCDSIQEFTALCNKTLTYFQYGNQSSQPFNTNVFLGDVGHTGVPGEAAHAVSVLNSIKAMLHPATYYNTVAESQHQDVWERILTSVAAWNAGYELAFFVSTSSGPYDPGYFFNVGSGYSIDMIGSGSFTPFVIAASCGTAAEYQTEKTIYGPNVTHDWLVADGKGAQVIMGPSAGTTQEGNREMGEQIAYRLQQNPARGGGESFRLAQRDVLQSLSPADWDTRIVARSYQPGFRGPRALSSARGLTAA